MFRSAENREWLFLSESPSHLELELADGTNVAPDADCVYQAGSLSTIVDLETHSPSTEWRGSIERVLTEFRTYREESLPIGGILLQKRTPGWRSNGLPREFKSDSLLSMTGHVTVEPAHLHDRETGNCIVGLFPFCDATGKPMCFPDGRPVGFRLGYHISFATFQPPQSANDNRSLNTARFDELCRECGNLLLELPREALGCIWARHRRTIPLPDNDTAHWYYAVFEFLWSQRGSKSPLSRRVIDETRLSSCKLTTDGLFPRVPTISFGDSVVAHQYQTEAGYPFGWASVIEDLTSDSIRLLEWINGENWKDAGPMTGPIRVFISYSHNDEGHVDRLRKILKPIERNGQIKLWYDRKLVPGTNLNEAIAEQAQNTDVFVFMLSDDFVASDYCTGVELELAMQRATQGEAYLVGLVTRPCMWQSVFPSDLPVLPEDANPITTWRQQDSAWLNVLQGLQRLFEHLQANSKPWKGMQPSGS